MQTTIEFFFFSSFSNCLFACKQVFDDIRTNVLRNSTFMKKQPRPTKTSTVGRNTAGKSATEKSNVRKSTASTTKDKILNAARDLFNQHGVETITVRHVAQHLGISHGNLCYHFPRREDIIFALYERVVQGMSAQVSLWTPDAISLGMVLGALRASFELQYEYRFLMIDFVNIMRRLPEVREHFRMMFEVRKHQFRTALESLRTQGILLQSIPDAQYERLLLHSYLMGDFWMSEAEILFTGSEKEKVPFYAELVCSLFVPYLTAKGQKEYDAFVRSAFS